MPVCWDGWVYDFCRCRELPESFKAVGLSPSYPTVCLSFICPVTGRCLVVPVPVLGYLSSSGDPVAQVRNVGFHCLSSRWTINEIDWTSSDRGLIIQMSMSKSNYVSSMSKSSLLFNRKRTKGVNSSRLGILEDEPSHCLKSNFFVSS